MMKHLSGKTKGTMIAATAVVVLSPDALLISLVRADDWTLIFWRGFLTAITLTIAFLSVHKARFLEEFKGIGIHGCMASLFFAVSTFSFVLSVRLSSAANTLVIVAGMPLIAAVFTRLFLKENVPFRTWAAVGAGFAGIAVVFSGSMKSQSLLGDGLALVTAVMMASNFVIIRSRKKVSMIPAIILSGIMTTFISAFMCYPFSLSTKDILWLSLLGTVVLPVPLALMTVAPKLIPAAEVGLIMLLETFLGPFWVWLVLSEEPEKKTMMGGGIIITTLIIHFYQGMREENKQG